MKELIDKAVRLYLVAVAFLACVVLALIVVARLAAYVPLLLAVVAALAVAWRWARGDWG